MARRPASAAHLPDFPPSLQVIFDRQGSARSTLGGSGQGQAEVDLGSRLRELRRSGGLSIRALSKLSGLAINTLSMIENGRHSPSVSTLQVLARALEVPITAFFTGEKIEKQVVCARDGQRPKVTVGAASLEHMGKDLAGNAVQPFVVTLQPGSGSGPEMVVHTGHELVYCLAGQVLYTVAGEDYLLAPGDSLVFESHLPHRWHNTAGEPTRMILVLIPADARDRPADRHFPLEPTQES